MRWGRGTRNGSGTELIAYRPEDRRADTRHGQRDGRKRIPSFTTLAEQAEAAARISTPYQDELTHTGAYEISEQYGLFVDRANGLRDQVARLRAALVTDLESIERGREALTAAEAPLTEDELQPRSPHELPIAGTPALHGRRATMREQRIAAARQELDRRRSAADERRQAISAANARIDQEFAQTQARARRLADYYVLRIAAYWDAVVQTHPDGRSLSSLLPAVSLRLPPWVDGTCQDGVITVPEPMEVTR
ncbi:hypothetical protein Ait01nite_082370 [Actinoplanes italicus]|uniref:Uncharacterized protein n=1 Tax=Actinoplanes italicus TaxID=113567 RepID=A0A2T0K3Q5_9ACTN|nr:hypothetical protein [Actinoplanes italicus]PRX17250.1 hypothetical protein CLV67_11626 [Actinoplanes italicus]GIE35192.1 hypothetical protein Ait01nite_082370 [Actinoplanes italicus]